MGFSPETYAVARKYTDDTVAGAGAVAGKPCQIQSITDITGGHRVTFLWVDNSGTEHTSTMDVMDGEKGDKGDAGDKGNDGFSPTIIVKSATSEEYILTITDASGSYDTPNLKGEGVGLVGTYSEENLSLR